MTHREPKLVRAKLESLELLERGRVTLLPARLEAQRRLPEVNPKPLPEEKTRTSNLTLPEPEEPPAPVAPFPKIPRLKLDISFSELLKMGPEEAVWQLNSLLFAKGWDRVGAVLFKKRSLFSSLFLEEGGAFGATVYLEKSAKGLTGHPFGIMMVAFTAWERFVTAHTGSSHRERLVQLLSDLYALKNWKEK